MSEWYNDENSGEEKRCARLACSRETERSKAHAEEGRLGASGRRI